MSPTPEAEARQNIDAMLAAHPEDLAKLAQRIRSKAVIPVHTEAATQFADFISNVCVLEDGVPVELNDLYA